jgi:hypothetical protein
LPEFFVHGGRRACGLTIGGHLAGRRRGELGANRLMDNLLVQPNDEDESWKVEEQLHRFKYRERTVGQAPVEVIDEYNDPADPVLGEFLTCRLHAAAMPGPLPLSSAVLVQHAVVRTDRFLKIYVRKLFRGRPSAGLVRQPPIQL